MAGTGAAAASSSRAPLPSYSVPGRRRSQLPLAAPLPEQIARSWLLPPHCHLVGQVLVVFPWPPPSLTRETDGADQGAPTKVELPLREQNKFNHADDHDGDADMVDLTVGDSVSLPPSPHYLLQSNLSQVIFGGKRSSALEHLLVRLRMQHVPLRLRIGQVHDPGHWCWLRSIYAAVCTRQDAASATPGAVIAMGASLRVNSRFNLIRVDHAYEILRRQCLAHPTSMRHQFPGAAELLRFAGPQAANELKPWPPSTLIATGTVPSTPSSMPLTTSEAAEARIVVDHSNSRLNTAIFDDMPDSWLSDLQLANLLHVLLRPDTREGLRITYPMSTACFLELLRNNSAKSGRQHRQDAEPSVIRHATYAKGTTVCAVNQGGHHWVLVILDGARKVAVLFDPLGHRAFSPAFQRSMQASLGAEWLLHDLQCHVQAEGHSCGMWLAHVADLWMQQLEDDDDDGSEAEVDDAASDANDSDWLDDDGIKPSATSRCKGGPAAGAGAAAAAASASPSVPLNELGERRLLARLISSRVAHLRCHRLTLASSTAEREDNRNFALALRDRYRALLRLHNAQGQLPYTVESVAQLHHSAEADVQIDEAVRRSCRDGATTANQAIIDLTDAVDLDELGTNNDAAAATASDDAMTGVGQADAWRDLSDGYIEFREDNETRTASNLRYSLPLKHQSQALRDDIAAFSAWRRQRFSLFRKGPQVEVSTIDGNISTLLRFLGYLFYHQQTRVGRHELGFSVFQRADAGELSLAWVEWLGGRAGLAHKAAHALQQCNGGAVLSPSPSSPPTAAAASSFQPVRHGTCANYLNKLVAVVKYALRDEDGSERAVQAVHRERLLEQLRNVRSQLDAYASTDKAFEKIHPDWMSWREVQQCRQRCLESFHQQWRDEWTRHVKHPESPNDAGQAVVTAPIAFRKELQQVCLLVALSISVPPRAGIVRMLEWDKTLVWDAAEQRWSISLTDRAHAASRHKTHKHRGALILPLPSMINSYLLVLRRVQEGAPRRQDVGGDAAAPSAAVRPVFRPNGKAVFLEVPAFSTYVKDAFRRWHPQGKAPAGSLLRSIWTTWLYSLQHDVEDPFLVEIRKSSAAWKAHSQRVAEGIYNRPQMYQAKQFATLLAFCEAYSNQFHSDTGKKPSALPSNGRKRARGMRGSVDASSDMHAVAPRPSQQPEAESETERYVVEELRDVSVRRGRRMVLTKWEGYDEPTWEPVDSMQHQLPKLMRTLERRLQPHMTDTRKRKKVDAPRR